MNREFTVVQVQVKARRVISEQLSLALFGDIVSLEEDLDGDLCAGCRSHNPSGRRPVDGASYRGLIRTLRDLMAPPGVPFSRMLNCREMGEGRSKRA